MVNKKLYRSRTNRMIAGVCGGLEEMPGVDATIWRLIFVLLMIPGGVPGPIVYIMMAIVMPLEPASSK